MAAQAGPFWVEVGKRLRAARHAKGYKPEEVEAIVSRRFSGVALSSYERGDRMPRLDDLLLMARTYEVSLDAFVPENWENLLP